MINAVEEILNLTVKTVITNDLVSASYGSPLEDVISSDADFYRLFVDFKGYVDYFFLQDCVSEDYAKVKIWEGDSSFIRNGLPDTIDGYMSYIDNEMRFLQNRNNRIKEFCEVYNI